MLKGGGAEKVLGVFSILIMGGGAATIFTLSSGEGGG